MSSLRSVKDFMSSRDVIAETYEAPEDYGVPTELDDEDRFNWGLNIHSDTSLSPTPYAGSDVTVGDTFADNFEVKIFESSAGIVEDFDFETIDETELTEKQTPTDVKWDMTTKEIRDFLKKNNIAARTFRQIVTGVRTVSVMVPKYDDRFTADQIARFSQVAKDLGLTGIRGDAIDVDTERKLTGKQQWTWRFHS